MWISLVACFYDGDRLRTHRSIHDRFLRGPTWSYLCSMRHSRSLTTRDTRDYPMNILLTLDVCGLHEVAVLY